MPSQDGNRFDPSVPPILGNDGTEIDSATTTDSNDLGPLGISIHHAVPLDQPDQVHQLTPALYQGYEVERGSVSLAGCLLEDVPFVHIVYSDADAVSRQPQLTATTDKADSEAFLDITGQSLSTERVRQMGLIDPLPIDAPPPAINPKELEQWLVSFLARHGSGCEELERQVERCTLIWCKKASGKIMLAIGSQQAMIPFSGWSRDLLLGKQKPPPFECPHTGRQSYRVMLTDAKQMTVPEAIKTCAKSGRRVLETELRPCAATGRLVLPEYLATCEATGDALLSDQLRTCPGCGQQVSPKALSDGECVTCRELTPAAADDQAVLRLVQNHAGLAKLRNWRISRSPTSTVLQGTTLLGAVRILCSVETGLIGHIARRSRLARLWKTVEKSNWPSLLD